MARGRTTAPKKAERRLTEVANGNGGSPTGANGDGGTATAERRAVVTTDTVAVPLLVLPAKQQQRTAHPPQRRRHEQDPLSAGTNAKNLRPFHGPQRQRTRRTSTTTTTRPAHRCPLRAMRRRPMPSAAPGPNAAAIAPRRVRRMTAPAARAAGTATATPRFQPRGRRCRTRWRGRAARDRHRRGGVQPTRCCRANTSPTRSTAPSGAAAASSLQWCPPAPTSAGGGDAPPPPVRASASRNIQSARARTAPVFHLPTVCGRMCASCASPLHASTIGIMYLSGYPTVCPPFFPLMRQLVALVLLQCPPSPWRPPFHFVNAPAVFCRLVSPTLAHNVPRNVRDVAPCAP